MLTVFLCTLQFVDIFDDKGSGLIVVDGPSLFKYTAPHSNGALNAVERGVRKNTFQLKGEWHE
jgi:hypothetical protein